MSRILLVEDDVVVRNVLHNGLAHYGHDVVTAENGAEGLAAFKAQPADLVITDIIMPEVEGVETICEIRKMNSTVPIIAISGSRYYLQDVADFGASEVFEKPVKIDALQAAIAKLLPALSVRRPG